MSDIRPLAISVKGATKRYGSTIVLDAVTLDVNPGEFLTLLGPSGSGKTTLLNIIAGFAKPDAGAVFVGEEEITHMPPHRRGLGIVFQSYALFPHMNVSENVAFPLKARGFERAAIEQRIDWALSLVKLHGFGARHIDQLSGGQKQRVALARAIVFGPRVILMDEPLSALDKQLRDEMQIEIRNLHEQIGSTTIYVTHDQREALTMSNRIAVLNKGKIVQLAPPRELYDRPTDAFVAAFIGEAMLVPVTREDDYTVLFEGRPMKSAYPVPQSTNLFLAVRSEKLRVAGEAADNVFEATVIQHIFQGESQIALLQMDSGLTFTFRQSTHIETDGILPAEGARAKFTLHPEHTVVVPRGSHSG